ncbi:MAG: DUF4190 domain-containing protein [Phycisphaerales bacterium]|nr:DUF4190 domain-containing protein [Phycisphaerales bacterium]MCB9837391.1 DUF4190 domain-containing protein [Phycisphaera sp.]
MTNDPYATTADFNDHYADAGPPRTSVLAILSLVCSLICFIPGLSAIGSLLGVFALLGISASKGRVKGTGLAIAGIAVGLIVSLLWIGGAVAIQQGAKQYLKMTDVMKDIESGSYDSARGQLTTATRPFATDEAFEAFKAAYQADAGQFQGSPKGLMDLFKAFGQLGKAQDPNTAPSRPYGHNQAPVPSNFQQGPRWVFVAINPDQPNDAGTFRALDNVGVWLKDDQIIWLVDPATLAAASAGVAPVETPTESGDDQQQEDSPADAGG